MEDKIELIRSKLDRIGEHIILWSRDGSFEGSITQEWPFTRFSTAIFVVGAYITFVLFGSVWLKMIKVYVLYFLFEKSGNFEKLEGAPNQLISLQICVQFMSNCPLLLYVCGG